MNSRSASECTTISSSDPITSDMLQCHTSPCSLPCYAQGPFSTQLPLDFRFRHDSIYGPESCYPWAWDHMLIYLSRSSFYSSSDRFLLMATLLSVPILAYFQSLEPSHALPFIDYFVFLVGYISKGDISTCCFCSKCCN